MPAGEAALATVVHRHRHRLTEHEHRLPIAPEPSHQYMSAIEPLPQVEYRRALAT